MFHHSLSSIHFMKWHTDVKIFLAKIYFFPFFLMASGWEDFAKKSL